jgi:hypothetical protein
MMPMPSNIIPATIPIMVVNRFILRLCENFLTGALRRVVGVESVRIF